MNSLQTVPRHRGNRMGQTSTSPLMHNDIDQPEERRTDRMNQSLIQRIHSHLASMSKRGIITGLAIGALYTAVILGTGYVYGISDRSATGDQRPGISDHSGPLLDELLKEQSNAMIEQQYDWLRRTGLQNKEKFNPAFSVLKASWPCVWGTNEMLGKLGDGVKWGCGLNWLAKRTEQECVAYSIGSNNDFSFEESVLQYLPHCKVFTFDPTVKEPRIPESIAQSVEFRKWGLAGKAQGDHLTMSQIMAKLGHSHIDILKIDIEGWEWSALFAMDERHEWPSIGQLQLEIHVGYYRDYRPSIVDPKDDSAMLLSLVQLLEKHSLRMFHEEVNQIAPGCCSEYSFIQKEWSPDRRDYRSKEE